MRRGLYPLVLMLADNGPFGYGPGSGVCGRRTLRTKNSSGVGDKMLCLPFEQTEGAHGRLYGGHQGWPGGGGARGPEVVAGKPDESRILHALSYTDNSLQMPPTGKLPDAVIADFRQWIELGAPDPRKDAPTTSATPAPLRGMSIADGKKWWSFQTVKELPAPAVKEQAWGRKKIDAFILAKLEENKLKPSPRPTRKPLVERAYLDLVGVKPTYEEVQAFVHDPAPNAYEKLIDQLLASPHYGERWGRHWLDVARYAEDNSTSEATNPPYPCLALPRLGD